MNHKISSSMDCSQCGKRGIFQTERTSQFVQSHEWHFGNAMNMDNYNIHTN